MCNNSHIYFSNASPNDDEECESNVVYKSFTSKSLFRPILNRLIVHLNSINSKELKTQSHM